MEKQKRKRIFSKGFFVDSTRHYGVYHELNEPIVTSSYQEKQIDCMTLNEMRPAVYMTKDQFDKHNVFGNILDTLDKFYPGDSVAKVSKKYHRVSIALSKFFEIYIQKKALISQG